MKCINYWCWPAFGSLPTQVWADMDNGQAFRVFGDGESRRVRKVAGAYSQPHVRSKKQLVEILSAVDEADQLGMNKASAA